ncbi:phage portal protein [Sphingomonas sp.]|uniref:phage portal protein n=1 Tax=Sphingomonas sp. TaxID=28214 RepID=UPI0035B3D4CA
MFDTITGLIPRDPDYPDRAWRLDVLARVLDGRLYDVLPYSFHDERDALGEYVPLRKRKPSVRYPLARIVVDDSLSLVFGEGHYPTFECGDDAARVVMGDLTAEARLNAVMQEAALAGSVGSVAILLRVLRGRVFFSVLPSQHLSPVWDSEEPDVLASVVERYKVRGSVLETQGYEIDDPHAEYWFMRRWDGERETWFRPWAVRGPELAAVDRARSVRHGLGFVPIVWIRNLPGGDGIDGGCTFRAAVETMIEIDYQLSQAGRGLKYSSDPTLLIREPAGAEGDMVRGGNALVVSEKGDAKLLEIGGTASAAVIEYVRTLREFALESVHGNRASPERLSAAQSGRALEMMNQGLIWLADNLRVSYGDAMLRLAQMVVRASNVYPLRVFGRPVAAIAPSLRWSLKWPRWHAPSAEDRERDARTLSMLVEGGQLSSVTALKSIADVYDIPDVEAEMALIARERKHD